MGMRVLLDMMQFWMSTGLHARCEFVQQSVCVWELHWLGTTHKFVWL